jgi:tripartite-type tricarboxylate transporter receptor subunit TctC
MHDTSAARAMTAAALPGDSRSVHADLVQATSDPDFKNALVTRGLEVRTSSPEQLGEFMERDYVKFRDLIQKLGLKMD